VQESPSQTYHCQCMGCPNGHGSAFTAAPEYWWTAKDMTPPKNCPDCRIWIKSQHDDATRCRQCGNPIRLPARYKISHYKKIGSYAPPAQCGYCERGEKQAKSIAQRRPRRVRTNKKQNERRKTFADLPLREDLAPRDLITDLHAYQYQITENHEGRRIRVTRQVHLERHLHGSAHSLIDLTKAQEFGLSRPKSPTSLVSEQAGVAELLSNVSAFSMSTDPDFVREYHDGDRIIRVTFTGDHDGLEISILEPFGNGQYGLVSSYDVTGQVLKIVRLGG